MLYVRNTLPSEFLKQTESAIVDQSHTAVYMKVTRYILS